MPWNAERWKEHRRAQGISPKSDMPTVIPEHVYQRGRELQAMMMLPMLDWPKNLFADVSKMVNGDGKLFDGKKTTDAHLCHCGCKKPHHHSVSRVVEETQYGHPTRYVAWYASMDCRNRHMGLVK